MEIRAARARYQDIGIWLGPAIVPLIPGTVLLSLLALLPASQVLG